VEHRIDLMKYRLDGPPGSLRPRADAHADDADEQTKTFYDAATDRFEMLLNIFKVFGHTPELGSCFTDSVMAMLKDAEVDWKTKELLILKATHRDECQYCVVQYEPVSQRLGVTEANRVSNDIWDRVKADYTEAQIVEAVYVVTHYIDRGEA
jgi:alkylhydroperoxidase family enzyme